MAAAGAEAENPFGKPQAPTNLRIVGDDATYVPVVSEPGLTLTGYHVYRDGVRITDTPVAVTDYTDNNASATTHTYVVSAVYNNGESATGEPVTVDTSSGIDAIESDSEVVGVRRFNMQGVEISASAACISSRYAVPTVPSPPASVCRADN